MVTAEPAEDLGIILCYFDSGVVVVVVVAGVVTSKAKQTLSVLPGYSGHYIH